MIRSFSIHIAHSLLELIAPLQCCFCSEKLYKSHERNDGYCQTCLDSLPEALPSDHVKERLLHTISADDIAMGDIIGLTTYSHDLPIHNAVYDFKYHKISKTAYSLGCVLGKKIHEYSLSLDYIVPIPIHPAKKRERGYNQAEEIAKGIHSILNIPILSSALQRTLYTPSQTTTGSRQARWDNVEKVFGIYSEKTQYHNKNVLLVDDVFTTGATTNNCASLLLQNGARKVDVAVIGITEKS